MMSDKRKAFEQYDFDKDDRWAQYKGNLTSSAGSIEGAQLTKFKQKFYKLHVDPNFELFDQNSTEQKSSSQNTSQPPQNSSARTTNSTTAPPRPVPQPVPLASYIFSVQMIWLVCNILVITHALLFLFGNSLAYFRTILFAAITYILPLCKIHGRPRFNQQYLAQIMLDDNFHYVMFCLFFYSKPYVVILAPVPIVTCAFYHVCTYFRQLLQTRAPTIYQRYAYIFDAIFARQVAIMELNANCEILIAAYLFVDIFLSGLLNGILMFFVYTNFLNLRYLRSAYTRSKLNTIGYNLDMYANHPSCPAVIRTLYFKIRQTVSSYFQPRVHNT